MKRLVLAAALIALAACTAQNGNEHAEAPKGPPPAELPPFEKTQGADVTNDSTRLAADQDGERLFLRRCGACHLQGDMGTLVLARRVPPDQALIQNRRDLTNEFVLHIVRNGQGAMPRMTRVDVTDAELRAIAAYLSRPRR